MKAGIVTTSILGLITAALILLCALDTITKDIREEHRALVISDDRLKNEALNILNTKCNVCHRKQNPLMLFKEKNISKRAKKIYQMVFIEQKMPKGNEIRLTDQEYLNLKKWLYTQKIF